VKRFVVAVVFATKLSSGAEGLCEAFLPPLLGGLGCVARGAPRFLRGVNGEPRASTVLTTK